MDRLEHCPLFVHVPLPQGGDGGGDGDGDVDEDAATCSPAASGSATSSTIPTDYALVSAKLLQPLFEKMKAAVHKVCGKAVQFVSDLIPEDLKQLWRQFNEVVAQLMAYADGARNLLQRLVKVVTDVADAVEKQLLHAVSNAREKVLALKNAKRGRRQSKEDHKAKEQQLLQNVLGTITHVSSDGASTLLGRIQAQWKALHEILDAAAAMLGGKLPCLDPQIGKAIKAHLDKFKGAIQAVVGDLKEQAMEALHEMANEVMENVTEAAGEAMDAMKEVGGQSLLGALGAGLNDMVQERAARKAKWWALIACVRSCCAMFAR